MSCRGSKIKKQSNDYLICSKNFITSENNQTPKTQRKRKKSDFSNQSARKSTIKNKQKPHQDYDLPKNFTHHQLYLKTKEHSHLSNDKTKRLCLTNNRRQHKYLSVAKIEKEEKRKKLEWESRKSLESVYTRCSQVLTCYQKKYEEVKRQNNKLKEQNKRLRQYV